MERKIGHIYWHENGNWGDRALGKGVQYLFRKYLGIKSFEIIPISKSKEKYPFKNYDLLIVGGGGLIIWLTLAFKGWLATFHSPTVVYGVGLNLFRTGPTRDQIFKESGLLKHIINQTKYFSVRNDGTREILKKYGITLPESPDPGFWAGRNVTLSSPVRKPFVCIQIAGDCLIARYLANRVNITSFAKNVRDLRKYFMLKGYKVIFTPHRWEDKYLANYHFLNDRPESWEIKDIFNNLDLGLSYYKHAKVVIGMRGHSQIIPLGMGTPVIAFGNQSKNLGLMKKLGLEEFHIPINDKDFLIKTIIAFEKIENNYQEIRRKIKQKVSKMEENLDKEFEVIRKRISF